MTDKQLRTKLYARQRRLLKLPDGHENVCLPGKLARLNPKIAKR